MTRYGDRSNAFPLTSATADAVSIPLLRKRSTALRPTRSLLALETRIVFDGAVHAALSEPHDAAAGIMHKAVAATLAEAARAPVAAHAADRVAAPALAPDRLATDATVKADAPTTIVFIDASVENPQSLLAGLKPGVEVIMLDKNSDGVQQIANALKGRHGLDSIQIISEGNSGRMLLGSATLADTNIDSYQAALVTWGSALREGGDILLFGCNVANTATGEHFVNRLAELTGADVAASTDPTGAAVLGGNWVLEKHTGAIEADKALAERAMADYDGLLLSGNGTADGDYDFGGTLGVADDGFRKLNDKLLVSDLLAQEGTQLYGNDANANTDGSIVTAVFKAEGTTVAKTFTFNDFSMSVTDPGGLRVRYFDQLQVVLRDTSGTIIGPEIKMSGASLVMGTSITKLSTLLNSNTEWSVANVASVTVIASLYAAGTNTAERQGGYGAEINFESMKMSNISAAAPNVAPTFVGAVTTLDVQQNGGTVDVRNLLHISDSDSAQPLTWSVASGGAPLHGTLNLNSATGTSGSIDITPGGTITYIPAAGYAGTDTFTVQVSDGTATVTRTITVTVAPATPGTPDLAPTSDGGITTDNVTNASSLTFSGTSGAGDNASSVSVFLDVNANGVYDAGDASSAATVNNGAWTVTGLSTTGVADGVYNVYAITTSNVGSVSSARSSGLAVTIDKTGPGAPSNAIVLGAGSDNGSSTSDSITSVTNPTVRVSLAGTGAGTSNIVELLLGGTALGTPVTKTLTGTDVANGYVDLTVTSGDLGGDGNKTLTARVTDVAGNVGTAGGSITITLDTTIATPSAPVLAAASDSGSSSADGITSVTTPTITGTAEAGSIVTLYDTDGSTVLGTATATGGMWSITSSALSAGAHNLTVKATDAAGNISAASPALAITIDTAAPGAPPAPVLAAASDSGSSNADGITSVTTPTITGTAEAGSLVTLYDTDGTTVLGTATATGGVWSITSSALSAGAHNLTVKATDAAGNPSAASPTLAITIDTTAPGAPPAPVLAAASDSGSSNADRITNVTTPTITGTAEAGSLVTLYDTDGTTVLGTATATGGVWSITSSALANGVHTLTAKALDAASNASAASASLAVTIDATAPATPPAPTLDTASDSGASNSDRITSINTPVINGTAESGSTVTLYDSDGSTVLGTATATGGVWSITSSALADGVHNLTVKALDAAGNASQASGALQITIATVATAPGGLALAAASDSGASNSDHITNVTTPTITGTALAGSIVTLYDTDGTTVLGTATATGGVWSITSTVALAEGTHSLTAKALDVVGNTSASSSTLSITIDTTLPGTPLNPLALAGASDSGSSNSDGLTNVTNPTVRFSLAGTNAVAGDSAELLLAGNALGTPARTTLTALDITNGYVDLSVTTGDLGADGSKSLTARVTDLAGNTGTAGGTLTITLDTAAATPAVPVLAPGSDNGSSNTDGVTSITTPVLTGTAEAGSLVTLYDTDGSTVLGTATATGGVWSITSSVLSAGAHSLSVKATDPSGNVSAASPALAINIDAAAPGAPPAPVLAPASDSGSSNTDGVTSITTPTITGTAEAGSLVTLYDTDGITVLGTTLVGVGGNWSITSSALAEGNHVLNVKATDKAGDTSAASPVLLVTIDTTAPAAPAAPVLSPASDNGPSNSDGVTSITRPTITGRAEAGSIVTLYDTDGVTVLGTTTAGIGGTWSITSGALSEGTHSLSAKATDSAGNTSSASPALQVTINTAAPGTPSAPVLSQASDNGPSNSDGITSVTRPTITGRAEAGSTVTLFDTNGVSVLGTTLVGASGAWSITSSVLGEGAHSLSAKATDAAGNTSAASPALAVTIDTTAPATPAAPVLSPASDNGASNSDGVTSVSRPTINGRAEAGSIVTLYDTDGVTVLGTTTAGTGGAWSITSSLLGDSSHSLSVKVTDAGGNTSSASAPLAVTIDTSAPAAPNVPVLSPASDNGASSTDAVTGVTRPTITGTAEAGSNITLYDTDGVTVLGTTLADASGAWSITSSALGEGTHSLSMKATDAAGNSSVASATLVVTIDTATPATPGLPVLSAASDNGASSNDGITSVRTPTVTDTAESGTTVTLYDSDGSTVLGTAVAVGGSWSISSSALAEGTHSLTVRAVDQAGNASAMSAPLTVVIDSTAPAAAGMPQLPGGEASTLDTLPLLTGTAEANSSVTVRSNDTVIGVVQADASGNWTLTAQLSLGNHQITATATDTAGNTGATSPAFNLNVLAPPAPVVTVPLPPAPPVLTPIVDVSAIATPPVGNAAQGQISQSPLAAAVQAAGPQPGSSFDTAPRAENVYVPLPPVPNALVVNKEIGNIAVQSGQTMSFAVPANTFISSDGSLPTLSVRLTDGSELPSWLSFNAATGTFSGSPPPGQAVLLEIEVVARDANGNEVRTIFQIQAGKPAGAPQASLSGKELLMALGLHKRVAQVGQADAAQDLAAVPADAELAAGAGSADLGEAETAVQTSALSGQLSHEAQRFAREARATLRHLAQI